MNRIAMIVDGVVEDISLWDKQTPWNPGEKYLLIDITGMPVEIGYIYSNGEFSKP